MSDGNKITNDIIAWVDAHAEEQLGFLMDLCNQIFLIRKAAFITQTHHKLKRDLSPIQILFEIE